MTAKRYGGRAVGLSLLIIGLLYSTMAAAQSSSVRVYRSTDASGGVHFSDQPPAAAQQAEVIEVHVATPQHDPAVQQRQQATREVTERMAADRQQREAQRQRVYRAGQLAQRGGAESAEPAVQAALPPVYPWVAWPVQHPRYLQPRRGLPPGAYWRNVPHTKPGDWRPPQRNPYPYSVIRSRYRGAAGEVFNPR